MEDLNACFTSLDFAWLEPRDISNAVLWLSSDEARYITGVALPVDAGWGNNAAPRSPTMRAR